MSLQPPQIDPRRFKEIFSETLARARVHNPEWNNYNASDPGITLLQLFAFMTESLLYRSNLIPERSRIKFLKLLGIPLRPATAAEGIVAFSSELAADQVRTLPSDLEVRAGNIPFRTADAVDVLPVEGRVYYKRALADTDPEAQRLKDYHRQLYGPYEDEGELVFYRTTPLEPPSDPASIPEIDLGDGQTVIDHALWVALLAGSPDEVERARGALANRALNVAVFPALAAAERTLPPERRGDGLELPPLLFDITTGATNGSGYARLTPELTGDPLAAAAIAKLRLPPATGIGTSPITEPLEAGTGDLPPALEDATDQARIVAWLRIRLPAEQSAAGLSARISLVAINAARVAQRTRVRDEILGVGTGEPEQSYALANQPVLRDGIRLSVDGRPWRLIEDLHAAPPEVAQRDPLWPEPTGDDARVFALDDGGVTFGTGLFGARPVGQIRASYAFGGGPEGNVAIGTITKGPTLPAGIRVINPLPTHGGTRPETVEEGERQIAATWRHKDRLVTGRDFRDIVARTPGAELGRVEILPLLDPAAPDLEAPGAVTIMVVPRTDPRQPDAPLPDRHLIDTVCDYLLPRRLVTTELHVRGPDYVPISVSVGVRAVPGRDFPEVREAVNGALRRILSPLDGGREGTGWPLATRVVAKELWAEAARAPGVAFVVDLLLGDADGAAVEEVPIGGLELPRLVAIETRQGDPERLDQLLNRAPPADARPIFPVPVIPDEC